MNELWFERIERYLQGKMSQDERLQFESEIAVNKELSSDVALFKTLDEEMRNDVKNNAFKQSIKHTVSDRFEEFLPGEGKGTKEIRTAGNKALYITLASIAASIIVIFLISYIFNFRQQLDRQQLAAKYISENLTELPFSMGSSTDSLEEGKQAFNRKDYGRALQLFKGAYKTDSSIDAKTYIGVVYLITKNFDKAIKEFEELSGIVNIKYNWGHFYKAVTLLYRNKAGDEQEAKQELEKVIRDNNAQGDEEAKKWLSALEERKP